MLEDAELQDLGLQSNIDTPDARHHVRRDKGLQNERLLEGEKIARSSKD
jgi:hypothetical protein